MTIHICYFVASNEMKKVNIVIAQIALVLVVLSLYYLYSTSFNKKEPVKSYFAKVLSISKSYGTISVPDSLNISLNNERVSFNKYLTNKNEESILIFRFSQLHCSSCISREVLFLKEYSEIIGWEKIVILATNDREYFLPRYKKAMKLGSDIIKVPEIFFSVDEEKLLTPYMLVWHNGEYKKLFISLKENEKRTEKYFENITKRYFNGK